MQSIGGSPPLGTKGMMAQAKSRQSQDPYAQQGKTLASLVQRLRGWVGSDPSRAPELADALIQLTAHRLLGHAYAAAAADAQESVRRAGEMLSAKGPIGPYTSISDAARYVTAVVHLATIQAGLGLPDAAGRTIESLGDMREQLRGNGLEQRLDPQTVVWALSCSARAALASGEVGAANAHADAALTRLAESDLEDDADAAYVAMDVDRLVSDCRWAAGRGEEALSYQYAAKSRYDDLVDGRLDEPARLSPALLERLADPLFGLYRDMSDRLTANTEVDLGLVTRRRLIELLRGLTGRLGDPVAVQLASALSDLASDLSAAGRVDGAEAVAAEATAAMPSGSDAAVEDLARGLVSRGTELITWTPLPASASYAATTASVETTKIVSPSALGAERERKLAVWFQFARPQARRLEHERMEQARIDAAHRAAEQVAAERAAAEKLAAERAEAAEAERLEAERLAAAEEAERLERKRRREERLEAHRLEVERREAERQAAEKHAIDPAEAERLELEKLQAEIDELERAERQAQAEHQAESPPTAD
jgi:hypothetical protein